MLKYGLNLNPKKKPNRPKSIPNAFASLGADATAPLAVQAAPAHITQPSERKRLKAELEKQKLLAEDPNVFAFDDVYETMAAQKQNRLAAKEATDVDRKPKYFDKLQKRCEERKIEQGVIYQRGIVRERIAEDHIFQTTEAFITSSYKSQMIQDKAWQSQQDIIDRREKGPTSSGMHGGFLSHILNAPPSPPLHQDHPGTSNANEELNPSTKSSPVLETKSVPVPKPPPLELQSMPRIQESLKRTQPEQSPSIVNLDAGSGVKKSRKEEMKPVSVASKAEQTAAARERYLKRKAERQNTTTTGD